MKHRPAFSTRYTPCRRKTRRCCTRTAEWVRADVAPLPFANSARDGYAVIAADAREARPGSAVAPSIVEDLPAGYLPAASATPACAVRSMAEAPMPAGPEAVVMVKHDQCANGQVSGEPEVPPAENVRERCVSRRRAD